MATMQQRIHIGNMTLYDDIHTMVAGELIYDLEEQKFFVVADESGRLLEITVADEVGPLFFKRRDLTDFSFEIVDYDNKEELILAPLEDIL